MNGILAIFGIAVVVVTIVVVVVLVAVLFVASIKPDSLNIDLDRKKRAREESSTKA
ncbi:MULTISPECIES: hypothetical protein [Nocardiaceae]|jgi:uncharacterized membrane-anchored protein|uniref:hypothetical protein n=1 Tax=Nocardiaceae TaxID=85025 RepID=UPI0005D8A45A|nr:MULTISPECIES: hypothetical protein [Rhodococcus]AJW41341.1 hypothetical protein NY08_3331 [Rhodococcus sp. B7740]MDZ7930705.1 hypothetical protein [Rhodococcus sp. (in: high G+C Gram-positive bacteria)]